MGRREWVTRRSKSKLATSKCDKDVVVHTPICEVCTTHGQITVSKLLHVCIKKLIVQSA